MNQILVLENKTKKKKVKTRSSGPSDIQNILRFFAVVIIIFGLVMIGQSSYAIYRDAKGNNTKDLATIDITRVNDTLVVDVQSTYIINRFKY